MKRETTVPKNLLLPYKFQIAGWWLIMASILLGIAIVVGDMNGWVKNVPTLLASIPAFAGILLVCLSREKVDDEYISALCGRIVCRLVAIAIVARIIHVIITVLSITYTWSPVWALNIISFFYQPILLAAMYIIILKATLFIQNHRLNRYAEQ